MKTKLPNGRALRYILLSVWVAFTVTLACWWIYFGFQQIDRLAQIGYPHAIELVKFQEMLLWEGGALIMCILSGAGFAGYYMYRELKQGDQIREFFVTFTHELKTSLAAVSLQAELIADKLKGTRDIDIVDRFIADTGTLALQLENSLTLANLSKRRAYFTNIKISEILQVIQAKFATLSLAQSGDATIKCDERALDTILSNLCHNSILHGKAKAVEVLVQNSDSAVVITLTDDGIGLKGNRNTLGQQFNRQYSGSGSGLGLYISCALAHAINGKLEFPSVNKGFQAVLTINRGING